MQIPSAGPSDDAPYHASGPASMPQDKEPLRGKKIAVIVESKFIPEEIAGYRKRFRDLGADVVLLSRIYYGDYRPGHPNWAPPKFFSDVDPLGPDPLGKPDVLELTDDGDFSRYRPQDFVAILTAANYVSTRLRWADLPTGLATREYVRSAPAARFFAQAMADKSIVKGALCHALWLVTPFPELLKGRKVTCQTVMMADVLNCGAEIVQAADGDRWKPADVAVDGDLITAFSIKQLDAFIDAIVRALTTEPPACGHEPPAPPTCHPQEMLWNALQTNDAGLLADAVNLGGNPNARIGHLTPLMIAAGRGQVGLVRTLLSVGADVWMVDTKLGASALHKAAQNGSIETARLLLEAGAFLQLQSAAVGHTPLMDAIWSKNPEMVRFLLSRGAIKNIRGHHQASADDFVGDQPTWTAGFTTPNAEWWGKAITAALAAPPPAEQPLMTAVLAGDLFRIQDLLAAGADVNERSPIVGGGNDGQTPLLVACFLGQVEIVKLLLAAGADVTDVDYLMQATPGHKAAYAGRPEALKILVDCEALDLNAQGPYNGYTALHDAVWHGHQAAVEVLLNCPRVRVDLKAHDSSTPYDLAAKHGYFAIGQLIQQAVTKKQTSPCRAATPAKEHWPS
jgi:ankyrin repeat protein/putative intracellular protease/amidase